MSNHRGEGTNRPVAIVTGGLQGLGLGAVCEMLDEGFDVAIVDLAANVALPDGVTSRLGAGKQCRYYQMDIADTERHETVLSAIEGDFGRLDCLVNNAGIAARPLTDILKLDTTAFDKSVEVNLKGTFFLTQKFANKLLAMGEPADGAYRSIINITSIAADFAITDRSQYCVTKSALSMVTKLFAKRLAPAGIHVHEIRPGFMQTEMTAKVGNDTIEALLARGYVPIPRWGKPEDVGQAIASLAAGRIPYMTGQPMWIAGGLNVANI
ncbi:3-ketoacyl-ACP reductase [Kordiimonas pumila]|uniref:3-ketoacyl-ACP reductase n=1 Tax=Kordiimonas pumila TaxID=2161677 RepID=A0ABV7D977_9PROT|nr:3-ketoacyl-ACP reductase [Kordiimonas pumila]